MTCGDNTSLMSWNTHTGSKNLLPADSDNYSIKHVFHVAVANKVPNQRASKLVLFTFIWCLVKCSFWYIHTHIKGIYPPSGQNNNNSDK